MTNNQTPTPGSGYWSAPGTYIYQSSYPMAALTQRYLRADVFGPGIPPIIDLFASTGYTLEYWFYATSYDGLGEIDGTGYGFTAGPGNRNMGSTGNPSNGWGFGPLEDGKVIMDLQYPDPGNPNRIYFIQVDYTFTLNTWTNFCVVFTPVGTGGLTSTVKVFINGTQTNVRYFRYGTTPPAYTSSVTAFCVTGYKPGGPKMVMGVNGSTQTWAGYMDEFRISNTIRYTSSYTPATSPFTTDSDTQLLMHFSGKSGSTVFNDSSNTANNLGGWSNKGQLPVVIDNSNVVF